MNSIEKPVLTTSGSQLRISCANFRTVTFTIQRDRDAHDVYMSVVELSKPRDVRSLFCFSYKPNKGELRQDTGWNFHDFQAEFQRQGWSLHHLLVIFTRISSRVSIARLCQSNLQNLIVQPNY